MTSADTRKSLPGLSRGSQMGLAPSEFGRLDETNGIPAGIARLRLQSHMGAATGSHLGHARVAGNGVRQQPGAHPVTVVTPDPRSDFQFARSCSAGIKAHGPPGCTNRPPPISIGWGWPRRRPTAGQIRPKPETPAPASRPGNTPPPALRWQRGGRPCVSGGILRPLRVMRSTSRRAGDDANRTPRRSHGGPGYSGMHPPGPPPMPPSERMRSAPMARWCLPCPSGHAWPLENASPEPPLDPPPLGEDDSPRLPSGTFPDPPNVP
jgi:hypothetical protein